MSCVIVETLIIYPRCRHSVAIAPQSLDYRLPPSCKAKLKQVWLCTCFVRRFRSARREAGRRSARPLCLLRPREAFSPIEGRRRMSKKPKYLLGLILTFRSSFLLPYLILPQRLPRPILCFKQYRSLSSDFKLCHWPTGTFTIAPPALMSTVSISTPFSS